MIIFLAHGVHLVEVVEQPDGLIAKKFICRINFLNVINTTAYHLSRSVVHLNRKGKVATYLTSLFCFVFSIQLTECVKYQLQNCR